MYTSLTNKDRAYIRYHKRMAAVAHDQKLRAKGRSPKPNRRK